MGELSYDQFPQSQRFFGFIICTLIGVAIFVLLPGDALFSAIFFASGLFMLLWRSCLIIRFDGRSWSYQKGLWPFVKRKVGAFADLNDIEVDTHLYQPSDQYGNTSDDTPSSNTYTAYLRFKDPSIGRQALMKGGSFGAAAKPAAVLAHRMGIPILLGRGSRGYDSQLSECVERAQYPNVPSYDP